MFLIWAFWAVFNCFYTGVTAPNKGAINLGNALFKTQMGNILNFSTVTNWEQDPFES